MIERAYAIFDRYLGYKIEATEYHEVIRYDRLARISNVPVVKLLAVKARAKHVYEAFYESTDWITIDPLTVYIEHYGNHAFIVLPPNVLGTEYTEVDVTYTAGLVDVPSDVASAVDEIASLLENGTINEWNCMLPAHVHDVIDRYRKEV